MAIDYGLKSRVMLEGIDNIQRKVAVAKFRGIYNSETGELVKPLKDGYTYSQAIEIESKYWSNMDDLTKWLEAIKINNASYKRKNRLKERINLMLLFGDCLFLTLTFTDKVLNDTSKETRRRYVTRFLKDNGLMYVANIDYGGKNGREHYHAVILIDKKIDNNNWTYGAINFERITIRHATSEKLSKYVSKLTNHAIKETTKRNSIIYSKMRDLELK